MRAASTEITSAHLLIRWPFPANLSESAFRLSSLGGLWMGECKATAKLVESDLKHPAFWESGAVS